MNKKIEDFYNNMPIPKPEDVLPEECLKPADSKNKKLSKTIIRFMAGATVLAACFMGGFIFYEYQHAFDYVGNSLQSITSLADANEATSKENAVSNGSKSADSYINSSKNSAVYNDDKNEEVSDNQNEKIDDDSEDIYMIYGNSKNADKDAVKDSIKTEEDTYNVGSDTSDSQVDDRGNVTVNLISDKDMSNVSIQIMNKNLEVLAKAVTDSENTAKLDCGDAKPRYLIVTTEKKSETFDLTEDNESIEVIKDKGIYTINVDAEGLQ